MKTDYREIAMRAMRKDLARNGMQSVRQPPQNGYKRIREVSPQSSYYPYRRLLLGKLVKPAANTMLGNWFTFVYDNDRKALNKAAGWSDMKEQYMFDNTTFV